MSGSTLIFRFMRDHIYSSASSLSKVSPLEFWRFAGLTCIRCTGFKPFGPLAPV